MKSKTAAVARSYTPHYCFEGSRPPTLIGVYDEPIPVVMVTPSIQPVVRGINDGSRGVLLDAPPALLAGDGGGGHGAV